MNIFEILERRKLQPSEEFGRLTLLFNFQWNHYTKASLKSFINGHFCSIPIQLRQTCLSVDDLLHVLNINEEPAYGRNWNELFLYCELITNLIDKVNYYINGDSDARNVAQRMSMNINVILDKTDHEWAKIKEGYVIVDKNPATTEAIECLEDGKADLALNMIEYNRVLLKGNLQRKREILVALADYTEPMSNDFKGTQYATLYSDSKFLVNAIDIRHNNSGKGDLPEKAKSWTPQEKEDWYDKTYQVLLTVILARKHMDVSKEIQNLKPAKK